MSCVERATTRTGVYQLRRTWAAEQPTTQALLLHGLNEHSGRYEHVGEALATAGISVAAHDHLGHGRTWGPRSWVASFDDFLDDVEDHLADLAAGSPELPVVLIGHSMGGLIAHAYCVSGRPPPDLLVSSGAALSLGGVPGWQRRLGQVLAKVAPKRLIPSKIEGEVLSRDPAIAEEYREDPLVGSGISAGLAQALQAGMAMHLEHRDALSVPALVLHGGADALVLPEATELVAGLPGVERHVLSELRHEIFNEIGRDAVIEQVIEWIRDQTQRLA